MKFTDDEITIKPGFIARNSQSCDYYARGQHLFHERTWVRSSPPGQRGPLTPAQLFWNLSGPGLDTTSQWFAGLADEATISALAKKHGGHALEDLYPEEGAEQLYYLAFADTEKALAFCRTEDFDRLCLTMEKLP